MGWFVAYVGASVIARTGGGLGVFAVSALFASISFVAPLWILVFAVMGAALMGTLGLIAGCGLKNSTSWQRSRTLSSCP
jgi:ABC-2 type transport system permease protein